MHDPGLLATKGVIEHGEYSTQQLKASVLGTRLGYYALLAAKQGAKVVAIEVDPENVNRIKDNVRINGVHNLQIVHAGIANKRGRLSVERRQDSRIMAHVKENPAGEIPLEMLDSIAKEPIDLLMMDIEGHELYALGVARHLLAEKKIGRILIEMHPKFLKENGQSDEELITFLENNDYVVDKVFADSPTVYYLLAA